MANCVPSYTKEEREIIKSNTHLCASEISDLTGRTLASVYSFCQRNGIKLIHKSAKLGVKC